MEKKTIQTRWSEVRTRFHSRVLPTASPASTDTNRVCDMGRLLFATGFLSNEKTIPMHTRPQGQGQSSRLVPGDTRCNNLHSTGQDCRAIQNAVADPLVAQRSRSPWPSDMTA